MDAKLATTPLTIAAAPRHITFIRPRCPFCSSLKLKVRSTRKRPNGWLHRYCICTFCGWTGKVIAK